MRRALSLLTLLVGLLVFAERGPLAAAEPASGKTPDVVYVPTRTTWC